MISRRTSRDPEEEVFPKLLYSDSTCSQVCHRSFQACCWRSQACTRCSRTCHWCSPTCRWHSQVHPMFSPVLRGVLKRITTTPIFLLNRLSEIPVNLKAVPSALLGSDTLLKLTHFSLHTTSSQTLLEVSSN
jgi:hypothetical protein